MLTKNEVFCCKQLRLLLNEPKLYFDYDAVFRSFYLDEHKMYYCPACGSCLPPALDEFYDEVQLKEFGVAPGWRYELESNGLLPEEFQSAKWWQKRQHCSAFPKQQLLSQAERLKKEFVLHLKGLPEETIEERYQMRLRWEKQVSAQKGIFCCNYSWLYAHHEYTTDGYFFYTDALISYEPEKRRCMLKSMVIRSTVLDLTYNLRYMIFYCIDCGSPLPKSLAKEWFEIVTKQFGVKDVFNRKELEQKLPPKYLSEEWWRKAGL